MQYLNPTIAFDAIRNFLDAGGPVLVLIMGITFFMWALILERIFYWTTANASVAKRARREWAARSDHKSWYAHAVRDKLISEVEQEASRFNGIIKALVAATPLLGLLGTVTGMVFVFDVMATTGSSNARLMASGISQATIPTMAGLVASLSGLVCINFFESYVRKSTNRIADDLLIE